MRNLPNVYSSYCPGAPVLNGTPGSLLEVFKACLTNGTAKITFPNIVVANGIATIESVTEGQVYFNGSRISIEGCDEPLLNKVVEVDSHTTDSFSFKTTVADGTYGGQIEIHQPGAGHQILFSGTNEAVFVSSNLDSLGVCVKIIDTTALHATVEIYENMTSLTAGVGRVDWAALYDNRRHARIAKAFSANATPVSWWLIADNTNVHIAIDRIDSGTITVPFETFCGGWATGWGQLEAVAEADKKNFFFYGPMAYTNTANGSYFSTYNFHPHYFLNTTPGDSNNHGVIMTASMRGTRGWMKFYPATFPIPYSNSNAITGGNKNYKMSYRLKPNYLYTDITAIAWGPGRVSSGLLLDSVLVGRMSELKFACNATWGQIKSFGIEVVNGKRYIHLPVFLSYGYRPSGSVDNNSLGLVPYLIGESWGD